MSRIPRNAAVRPPRRVAFGAFPLPLRSTGFSEQVSAGGRAGSRFCTWEEGRHGLSTGFLSTDRVDAGPTDKG